VPIVPAREMCYIVALTGRGKKMPLVFWFPKVCTPSLKPYIFLDGLPAIRPDAEV